MEFIYSNCHDRETFVVIITLSYNFMTVLSVSLFNFIGWNRTSQKQENRSELITPQPLIIYGGGGQYCPYSLYWRRLCCQSFQISASILYGSFLFMTGDLLRKKIPANIIKYSPNYCLEWFLAKLRFFIEKCSVYSESISICILYSGKGRNISPFLYRVLLVYRAQNLPSLLFYLQTWRYRHCWS